MPMLAVHRLSLGVTCELMKVYSFCPHFSPTAWRMRWLCVSAQTKGQNTAQKRSCALSRDS